MPSKSPRSALVDIRENIALARQFVAGLSFDAFIVERKTVYATMVWPTIVTCCLNLR
jgi:uncharacterized protein with HEPN domain